MKKIKQLIKYTLAHAYALVHPKLKERMNAAKPIFIVACGHSGTSVLLAMLDSHSQIQAINEESQILQFEENPTIIRWKFHKKTKDFKASRWVEKTPRHVHHIGKLLEVFPTAKIIILLRDGRDVACSIKKRYGDFEQGITRWIVDNEAALPYWSHERTYVLKLENLQAQSTKTLQNLMAFLDLPFEENLLTFHKEKRFFYDEKISYSEGDKGEEEHSQRRNWQINQPLQKSTSRWKQEMTGTEKEAFKKQAQELLERFDYASDSNW